MNANWIVGLYTLAFVALTGADAASTLFGLAHGAQEFNPAVKTEQGVHLMQMMALNLAMLAGSGFMLHWALRNIDEADPKHIAEPMRGLLSWMQLNPFAVKNRPAAVFAYLALPILLLMAKAIASINNVMIGLGVESPITTLAHAMITLFNGDMTLGYWATILIAFTPAHMVSLWLVSLALRGRRDGPVSVAA